MESASGRQWPRGKPSDARASAAANAGHPVFCHNMELAVHRCVAQLGKTAPECTDAMDQWRQCMEQKKSNIQVAVIDCSAYHTGSMRCLEDNYYDKDACAESFLKYKMCNGQRQASLAWAKKLAKDAKKLNETTRAG
ncbi:hypothetical protein T492DRAFT_1073873 [Pavlovales sp. CCMP2436]|nr:hypothetical protein T492DRAFT_1073873 [Pavlovales sp. CCMP2436]|mmetsp:Transcript_25564/g.64956  ORF Transcript_25564/g.64956 Transcript_25564/m.64956 type:complete len:137 (+) Transcript_25564:82-492(+)